MEQNNTRYRYLRFPDGRSKAVTFSYDDGCRHDLKLVSILNEYGIKCTFNICGGRLGTSTDSWHLTKDEVSRFLLGAGHEIAVHGQNHRAPGKLRSIDAIQDVLNCRLSLEKDFGIIVRGMAYPDSGITEFENGASYEDIRNILTDLDIAYSRTLGQDNNTFALPTDWYHWVPTVHHDNPLIFDYIKEFTELSVDQLYCCHRTPRLFYLWGHSFEYENKKNWDHLTKICRDLGNRPDIWYATNMEIYTYVTAYRSLIFSADSNMVYNPTLVTVWFDVDGKLFSIRSGETLHI